MSLDIHTSLTRRADSVPVSAIDPAGVVLQGERLLRRRRRRRVTAGAALTAVIAIAASAVGGQRSQHVDPAPDHGVVRPVTYGVGEVLHLGDREVDTGMDFLSIDVTDDGAALTTFDGGIWFTDGASVERVGESLPLQALGKGADLGWSAPSGRPRDWVVNDSGGSLLAWVEFRDGDRDRQELVVYDTARREVVTRRPLEARDRTGERVVHSVTALAGREVYVSATNSHGVTAPELERHSLDSGAVATVGRDVVGEAVRAGRRAVVIGRSVELGEVALRLARAWDRHHIDRVEVSDGRATQLYDAHTGGVLPLRLPEATESAMWIVQWVDDDQLTVVTGQVPDGDLLTCRISTLSCEVTIERSAWDDHGPIIPGFGGVGGEWAQVSAARAARD